MWILILMLIIAVFWIISVKNTSNELEIKNHNQANVIKDKTEKLEKQLQSEKALRLEYDRLSSEHKSTLSSMISEHKLEIDTIRNQHQRQLDILEKQIYEYKLAIENPEGFITYVADLISEKAFFECNELENYFLTKKNPSYNSATTVRQFKEDYKSAVKKQKLAEFRYNYLLSLFPQLEDYTSDEIAEELQFSQEQVEAIEEATDPVKNYISDEEWISLSSTERNQRALDNYIKSHRKTKWQIGRDYELYIGYVYQKKGYSVEYTGTLAKFEDMGRDLICRKDDEVLIVQCKYWSQEKTIHENHINQLYGTTLAYAIVNRLPKEKVKGVLITNTVLSDMAISFANILGVEYKQNIPIKDFPRIKCNINYDSYGTRHYIYHLPMDQQYDRTIISEKGEFFAFTVAEAEEAGFRRAFKHHYQ